MDQLRDVGLLPPLILAEYDGDDHEYYTDDGSGRSVVELFENETRNPESSSPEKSNKNDDNNNTTTTSDNDNNNNCNDGGDGGDTDNHAANHEEKIDIASSPSPSSTSGPYAIRLLRAAHASYLSGALSDPLSRGFVSLDASHPWMVYWCLHSLDLLGYFDEDDDDDEKKKSKSKRSGDDDDDNNVAWIEDVEVFQRGILLQRIVSTLKHCWMDVRLEFAREEVAKNWRLKHLFVAAPDRDHHCNSNNDNNNNIIVHDYADSATSSPAATLAGMTTTVSIVGGGFGGGPQQLPHCATTYAAVLALSIVAGLGLKWTRDHPYHEPGRLAMDLLITIRLPLYAFYLSLREEYDANGKNKKEDMTAFRMQHDGEIDVRASYCILAPSYLLGLLNKSDDADDVDDDDNPLLSPSVPRYIASCQTFEGGFGAEPFNEAHGGYTFCALAALRIVNGIPLIDVHALSSWLARRQMGYEGGFCGRTNKLVDGCYSFWQGGAVAVLDSWRNFEGRNDTTACKSTNCELSFDEVMLQRYILLCAQDVNGGLRDKPSKPKDFYHSCYNLSGLSVAQNASKPWPPSIDEATTGDDWNGAKFKKLFGDVNTNIVGRTDPVLNIREERVRFMLFHQC